ncbi:hypothetical protein [Spirillospora sp. CA-294931]|uniref:hypothetical protein n=1 Tax=Spirillospora sp. CA-294931 TaxID=3240042 RepID=UPI003D919C4D
MAHRTADRLAPDPRARPTAQQLLLALVGGTEATPAAAPTDILTVANHSIHAHWSPEDLPLWTPPTTPLPPVTGPPPIDPKVPRRAARVLDPAHQRLIGAADANEGAIMMFRGTAAPGPKTKVKPTSVPTSGSFSGVLLYDVPPKAVELHVDGTSKGVHLPVS